MAVIIISIYLAHPVHSFMPSSCIINERKPASTITLQGGGGVGNDEENLDVKIISLQSILNRASKTKKEDPDLVMNTLEDLEKKMRAKRKAKGLSVSRDILQNLNGSWRLIFTTGTRDSQEKLKARINYFPLKAVQSFDTTSDPPAIENGIYLGNICALKFMGDFEFDLKKSRLEFKFGRIAILGLVLDIDRAEAARFGASTGLGSKNNVKKAEKGKNAFFNWISADENIATARGGGGGLALWARILPGEN